MEIVCVLLDNGELLPKIARAAKSLGCEIACGESSFFLKTENARPLKKSLYKFGFLFGTGIRLGIANDPSTALAFAHTGEKSRENLSFRCLKYYFNPFAPSSFLKEWEELMEPILDEKISFLAATPKNTFPSCSRDASLLALERWGKPAELLWPEFCNEESVFEYCDSDAGIALERVLSQIRGLEKTVSILSVFCQDESFDIYLRPDENSSIAIMEKIKNRGILNPTGFLVKESVPGLYRPKEKLVWKRLLEHIDRELSTLKFPLRSIAQEATLFDRPNLACLDIPEEILVQETFVCRRGQESQIKSLLGPALVKGEWWFKENQRNYYRVLLESGEEWWIFQNEKRQTFLHGIVA